MKHSEQYKVSNSQKEQSNKPKDRDQRECITEHKQLVNTVEEGLTEYNVDLVNIQTRTNQTQQRSTNQRQNTSFSQIQQISTRMQQAQPPPVLYTQNTSDVMYAQNPQQNLLYIR